MSAFITFFEHFQLKPLYIVNIFNLKHYLLDNNINKIISQIFKKKLKFKKWISIIYLV